MISVIRTQAHIQLLRAEWYRVLNILYWRISPTIYLKEEVKFQSYVLSSLVFFIGKQYENAYKGSLKSTEDHWNFFIKVNFFIIFNFSIRRNTIFSRMNIFFNDIGNVIFNCTFSGEDHLCVFDRRVISYL